MFIVKINWFQMKATRFLNTNSDQYFREKNIYVRTPIV